MTTSTILLALILIFVIVGQFLLVTHLRNKAINKQISKAKSDLIEKAFSKQIGEE